MCAPLRRLFVRGAARICGAGAGREGGRWALVLPPTRGADRSWLAAKLRTAMATGRNSSGTRRRRSSWAARAAAGVSAAGGQRGAGGTCGGSRARSR